MKVQSGVGEFLEGKLRQLFEGRLIIEFSYRDLFENLSEGLAIH